MILIDTLSPIVQYNSNPKWLRLVYNLNNNTMFTDEECDAVIAYYGLNPLQD